MAREVRRHGNRAKKRPHVNSNNIHLEKAHKKEGLLLSSAEICFMPEKCVNLPLIIQNGILLQDTMTLSGLHEG